MQKQIFTILLVLCLFSPIITIKTSVSNTLLAQAGVTIDSRKHNNKWVWQSDSCQSQISENEVKNTGLVISFVDTQVTNDSEFEVKVKDHSLSENSYVCFGLYPKDQIEDLKQNADVSQRKNAATACTDDFLNNPYGSLAKQGQPPLREDEAYKISYSNGIMLIQTTRDEAFKGDYILNVEKSYVPYVEVFQAQGLSLSQINAQAADSPDQWEWQTISNGIKISGSNFNADSPSTQATVFVNVEEQLKDQDSWQIKIEEQQLTGYVCIGLSPSNTFERGIQPYPNASHRSGTFSACTDKTYYDTVNRSKKSKKPQPEKYSLTGNIDFGTNANGKEYLLVYTGSSLIISNEIYGGSFKIEFELIEGQKYYPFIEIKGDQSVSVGQDIQTPYEFNWYSRSKAHKLENAIATAVGDNQIAKFLNDDVLTNKITYSVDILELQESLGWVCFGVLPQENVLSCNALPDVTNMASSVGACTDGTSLFKNGAVVAETHVMPANPQGRTFYVTYTKNVEKKINSISIQDNTGEYKQEFDLVSVNKENVDLQAEYEANYVPFIEIKGQSKIALTEGVVEPNSLPESPEIKEEDNADTGNTVPEQNFEFDGQWQTYASYGDIDESDLLRATSTSDKVVTAYSGIRMQANLGFSVEIANFNAEGKVCVGVVQDKIKTDLKHKADYSALDNSIAVCTDGNTFTQGLDAISEEGTIDGNDGSVHVRFFKTRITIVFGSFVGSYQLNSENYYIPYVEATQVQTVKLGKFKAHIPALIPSTSWAGEWTSESTGFASVDGVLSQQNAEGITEAFIPSPLQHYTSYEVQVISQSDDSDTWICFGAFPFPQKDQLVNDADNEKFHLSISACNDDTYNDIFDNQSIEKTGNMPYRSKSVSKTFTVFLFDLILAIYDEDQQLQVTYRADKTQQYVPWIEIKGDQSVRVGQFTTYQKVLAGEAQEETKEIEQDRAEKKELVIAAAEEEVQEKEVIVESNVAVYGDILVASSEDKFEKQITSEKAGKGMVISKYSISQVAYTWYVYIGFQSQEANIVFGIVDELYIHSMVDATKAHFDSEHVSAISTLTGTQSNGQGAQSHVGQFAIGGNNSGKIYEFKYANRQLKVTDLGGTYVGTFSVDSQDSNQYLFIQVHGEAQFMISETEPIASVEVLQEIDQQIAEQGKKTTEVTHSGVSWQTMVTHYKGYGNQVKLIHKEKNAAGVERFILKIQRTGWGSFIGQYISGNEDVTYYYKVGGLYKTTKWSFGWINSDFSEQLQSGKYDFQGNSQGLGFSNDGEQFNFDGDYKTEGVDVTGVDTKKQWYMFQYSASEQTLTVHCLNNGWSIVYQLSESKTYQPFIIGDDRLRIRVSSVAPASFRNQVKDIDPEVEDFVEDIEEEDEKDDDKFDDVEDKSKDGEQGVGESKEEEKGVEYIEDGEQEDQKDGEEQQQGEEKQEQEEGVGETVDGEVEKEDHPGTWQHEKNSDRGTKISDNVCEGEEKPINFFVDVNLNEQTCWKYEVIQHQPEGFICFGILPRSLYKNLIKLPDAFHFEESVSACTDGSFYNGPNNHKKIYVDGEIKQKEQNTGITYILSKYSDKLVIQEQDGDFKSEMKFDSSISFIPWFEVYGKQQIMFHPDSAECASPMDHSETEEIEERIEEFDGEESASEQEEEAEDKSDGEIPFADGETETSDEPYVEGDSFENESTEAEEEEEEKKEEEKKSEGEGEKQKAEEEEEKEEEKKKSAEEEKEEEKKKPAEEEEGEKKESEEEEEGQKKESEEEEEKEKEGTGEQKESEEEKEKEKSDGEQKESEEEEEKQKEGTGEKEKPPGSGTLEEKEKPPGSGTIEDYEDEDTAQEDEAEEEEEGEKKESEEEEEKEKEGTGEQKESEEEEEKEKSDGEQKESEEEEEKQKEGTGEKQESEEEKEKSEEKKSEGGESGKSDGEDCIKIYSECGYKGESAAICGEQPFDFEHEIKSVKIPPGEGKCITLFHICNFKGFTSVITHDVECLDNFDGQFLLQQNIKIYKGDVSALNEIEVNSVMDIFSQKSSSTHLRKSHNKPQVQTSSTVQMMTLENLAQITKTE